MSSSPLTNPLTPHTSVDTSDGNDRIELSTKSEDLDDVFRGTPKSNEMENANRILVGGSNRNCLNPNINELAPSLFGDPHHQATPFLQMMHHKDFHVPHVSPMMPKHSIDDHSVMQLHYNQPHHSTFLQHSLPFLHSHVYSTAPASPPSHYSPHISHHIQHSSHQMHSQMPILFDHSSIMNNNLDSDHMHNHNTHSSMVQKPSPHFVGQTSTQNSCISFPPRFHKDMFDSKLMVSLHDQQSMALQIPQSMSFSKLFPPTGRFDVSSYSSINPGNGKPDGLEGHHHPNVSDLENMRAMSSSVSASLLGPGMSRMDENRDNPVAHWTQNDVLQWLKRIRLENLQAIFQKHEITGDMLLDLGEEDLSQELGINSGLIRKKLFRELRALKDIQRSIPSNSSKIGLMESPGLSLSSLGPSPIDDAEYDLAQCVIGLNNVMHDECLSQPKVARALGIQSQGHLSELLRGKYKHSRNASAEQWAKQIRGFLALTPKQRQDSIYSIGQNNGGKKRRSSKRTVWSKDQAMMLDNFFHHKPSPSKSERQLLASQCGVDVSVVNTYFQNKRRRTRHLQGGSASS